MNKRLYTALVTFLVSGLVVLGGCPLTGDGGGNPGLIALTDGETTTIHVQNIADGVTGGTEHGFCEQDPEEQDEWHFVINGLNPSEAAPGQMTAVFAEDTVTIALAELTGGRTSGVAHYRLGGFLGAALLEAWAELSVNATYGSFVLSHAPCGEAPPVQYDLMVSSTEGGSVTDPGEGTFTYDASTVVGLIAAPDPGYRFGHWSGDMSGNSSSTSVIMDGDKSVMAKFAIMQYTLTYTAGTGGNISGDTPQTVSHGDSGTQVEAVADPGYGFVNWSDGSTQNPRTDTNVTGDIAVTASFARMQYELTVNSTAGGYVSIPGDGTFTYDGGTVVTLRATANPGYQFSHWSGDLSGTSRWTSIVMNGNKGVTANFLVMPEVDDGGTGGPVLPTSQYNVTVSSTPGGWVIDPGYGTFTYARGTVVNLVAEPCEGYRFVKWVGDTYAVALVNSASTTITIQGDCQISARFERGIGGPAVRITGVTRGADGAILTGADVVLYQNGEAVANAASDETGHYYALVALGPGSYDVLVSSAGFRNEAQSISVSALTTSVLNFVGDYSLIPSAPSTPYVLACMSLWKLGEAPLKLSTSKMLQVISAWLHGQSGG